jgi:hypothetical protein
MKKGLLTLLIVLFATAVYADVTFSISGDAWERGDFIRNQDFLDKVTQTASLGALSPTIYNGPVSTTKDTSQAFYDGAFFLYPKITMDNAEINMRLAIRKQIWDSSYDAFESPDANAGSSASNILVDRAYLTYHFSKDSTLDVGLQEAFTWGSSFADNEGNAYRVKFAQTTPVGLFGVVLEKFAEQSNADIPDNNYKDASDIAFFGVTKAGDIWVKPLIYLLNWSSGFTTGPLKAYPDSRIGYYALELNGDLGPASFDSEFGYKTWHFTSVDSNAYKDPNVWGAYVTVFKALDVAKPGLTLVYDSWDKDDGPKNPATGKPLGWGFDSGNDFKSNLIFGGQGVDHENPVSVPLGENPWEAEIDGADLMAFTMIKPYIVDIKTPIPNLTGSASVSYMSSNQKDTMWDGAKAYEVDLGAAYQLSKYVVYSVGAGYGKCDFSSKGKELGGLKGNPDAIYAVQHMIKINF